MRPALSVIIPTRNRRETLRRTLEAWIRHESRAPLELIVVDDGSEDGTDAYLKETAAAKPRLTALSQAHSGPAQARNLAIRQARGDYLLFGGDDIRPADGLADGHLKAHASLPPSVVVLGRTEWDPDRPITPVMRHITGFGAQQFRYGYLKDRQRLGFKYFYGSNLSLRRDAVASLPGPFDGDFGGAALEDADLGYRLMDGRRDIEYQQGLLAWHDHPYDLAGFTRRQQRVGQATAALATKHPQIAAEFGWDLVTNAIAAAAATPKKIGAISSLRDVEQMEAEIVAALGSVEHLVHRKLERVYLGLFWYFQAKGIATTRVAQEDLASVLLTLMEGSLVYPLKGALRRPEWGLTDEARVGLNGVVTRLWGRRSRGGSILEGLRFELSSVARELLYSVQGHRLGGDT